MDPIDLWLHLRIGPEIEKKGGASKDAERRAADSGAAPGSLDYRLAHS